MKKQIRIIEMIFRPDSSFYNFQSGVYCMSTGQPIIRLPLFIMGIAAGLHVLRYHNKKSYKDENLNKNLFFIIFPWSLNLNKEVNEKLKILNDSEAPSKQDSPRVIWRKRVDFSVGLIATSTASLIILHKILDFYTRKESLPESLKGMFLIELMNEGFFHHLLQLIFVHMQLTIIIGLCMDDGISFTSRFLRSKALQFLGRISYSLYLTHWPVMGFVSLAIKGQEVCQNENEVREFLSWWNKCAILPLWSPFLTIFIAILFAFFVTKYFEEPLKKSTSLFKLRS